MKTQISADGHPRHFIKEWRKAAKLTQEQLASILEVAVSGISQLETGKQGYSQPMLEALADAFDCEPADLLMKNPLMKDATWSLQEKLVKATPERQREILLIVDTMLNMETTA